VSLPASDLPTYGRTDRWEARANALLSAIKIHRNATESRLRLLDSRGEAARCMLKPDRDLYETAERIEAGR